MGNLTQKGKCVPWKGQWHWQTTKSVYIYTFVFTGTYTGPFCHNPVESRLIPLDSSSIPLDSGSIPLDSCGFLWNPAELMHSCRNLWGIKKYSPRREISSQFSPLVEEQGCCTHVLLFHQTLTVLFQFRHCRAILMSRWCHIPCRQWSPSYPGHWQVGFQHLQNLHLEEPRSHPSTPLWVNSTFPIYFHPHSLWNPNFLLLADFISIVYILTGCKPR